MVRTLPFNDRKDAGSKLAYALLRYLPMQPVLFAMPGGATDVAARISSLMDMRMIPLEAFSVDLPESVLGSIETDPETSSDVLMKRDPGELQRSVIPSESYDLAPSAVSDVRDVTAIVVDDGTTDMVTLRATLETIRNMLPRRLVYASPVCRLGDAVMLSALTDDVVGLIAVDDSVFHGRVYAEE